MASEGGGAVRDAAADHHEVVRRRPAANLAQAALEADAGDVVLAAAVRAPADLDVEARHRRDEIGARVKPIPEQTAEAARLGHRELARLGSRAARDVCDRPRTAARQSGGVEAPIQRLDVATVHPAEDEVLIGGNAHACRRRTPTPARR